MKQDSKRNGANDRKNLEYVSFAPATVHEKRLSDVTPAYPASEAAGADAQSCAFDGRRVRSSQGQRSLSANSNRSSKSIVRPGHRSIFYSLPSSVARVIVIQLFFAGLGRGYGNPP